MAGGGKGKTASDATLALETGSVRYLAALFVETTTV